MNLDVLNTELREAISGCSIESVSKTLRKGADPNFNIDHIYTSYDARIELQPYNPIRLLVFIMSSCDLNAEDLFKLLPIAKLLICAGASAESACEIAKNRYGTFKRKDIKELLQLEMHEMAFYMLLEYLYQEVERAR